MMGRVTISVSITTTPFWMSILEDESKKRKLLLTGLKESKEL